MIYCPGHAIFCLNEREDSLASKAPISRIPTMGKTEILKIIRNNLMTHESATEEALMMMMYISIYWTSVGSVDCHRFLNGHPSTCN